MENKVEKFAVAMIVNNRFGVLNRIAGLYAKRCYNIDNISAGTLDDPNYTRITIVLFDNDVLGMVRQWQTIFYDCHYSQTILDRKTDFPALAKAFGADGYAVYTMEDLKKALDVADKSQGPVLIDCHIDMDEKVLPMIPPGRSIKDMIVEG